MKSKISILDKIAIGLFLVLLVVALLFFTVKNIKTIANTAYTASITSDSIIQQNKL